MAYFVAIYDWSLYTLPAALSTANIENATFGHGTPSWLGETFTYNGGASTLLEIDDDDGDFEDAYVETGPTPQTLTQDVTINDTTFFAGSIVENEFAMLDASGNEIWVVRIDGTNVGFAYPAGEDPSPGQSFVGVTGRDGDPNDSQDGTGSIEPYSGVICFASGAKIATPVGNRRVEQLRIGDWVATLDGPPKPVKWMSQRTVSFENTAPEAKPVQIKRGALGRNLPCDDLVVSPQHRILLRDLRVTGSRGVFVAAKAMTWLPGVRTMKGKISVNYIHFAFDCHEIVVANGVLSESCYMGPELIKTTTGVERLEIKSIFPQVNFEASDGYGGTARPVIPVRKARDLISQGSLVYDPAMAADKLHREEKTAGNQRRSRLDRNRGFQGDLKALRSTVM